MQVSFIRCQKEGSVCQGLGGRADFAGAMAASLSRCPASERWYGDTRFAGRCLRESSGYQLDEFGRGHAFPGGQLALERPGERGTGDESGRIAGATVFRAGIFLWPQTKRTTRSKTTTNCDRGHDRHDTWRRGEVSRCGGGLPRYSGEMRYRKESPRS